MLTEKQELALHEFFVKNEPQMWADLLRIARVPSVIGKAEPGAPFGVESRRVLDEVKALFAENGIESVIDEDRYLLAYAGNTDSAERIGVYAHADVVPVDDKWIVTQPFEPVIKDGMIYGRGVHDNKCAVIYALYFVKAMRELGLPFHKKFEIFVGSNEEAGMGDIKAYAKKHGYPDMGLVVDASFPCVRGEKCILRVNARSPKLTDVIEAYGGEAYNVALGEVKLRVKGTDKLAMLREKADERIRVEQDGGDTIVVATGMSKHASAPHGSLNAMLLAARLLAECGIETDAMTTTAEVLGDYYGGVCGVAAMDPDFDRLTMVNGIVRLEEGRLFITFDIRFGPSSDLDEVYEKIAAWFAARGWEAEKRSGTRGYSLPADSPMIAAALAEYERFMGKPGKPVYMGGGTYARNLGGHAMPIGLELREKPVELPAGHGGSHQPDECHECAGGLRAAELIARVLLRLGE